MDFLWIFSDFSHGFPNSTEIHWLSHFEVQLHLLVHGYKHAMNDPQRVRPGVADSDCGYSEWRIGSFWWTLAWNRLLLAHSSSKIIKYHTCDFSLKPLKCVQPLSFFQYFAGYSGRLLKRCQVTFHESHTEYYYEVFYRRLGSTARARPGPQPRMERLRTVSGCSNWTMCLPKKSYCSGQRYDILLIMMKGMILSGDVWVVVKSGHPTCWMINCWLLGCHIMPYLWLKPFNQGCVNHC